MREDVADRAPDSSPVLLEPETPVTQGEGEENGQNYQGSRLVIRIGAALFVGQFIALIIYSWVQYHRFDLGIDFATMDQATAEISRGNLNPYSTIVGSSYLDNHFGLIMWPISALLVVFRSPYLLLVIQDLCLVATGFVTFLWASQIVAARGISRRFGYGIVAVAVVLLLLDPLVYFSAALDFHLEATATFFAVFAAYDIWTGRNRRAWIWVAVCLLCGDLGGLCIAGIGISALLAGKATRRMGGILIVVGVGWVAMIGALHANQGSFLNQYAYLAGRATLPTGSGALVVLGGMITHPGRPYHALASKARLIWRWLPPGGVIGIITPWGFGVPAVVLLSSALQGDVLFIGEPFQQFAVVPFVLIGSVTLLTALAASRVPLFRSSPRWTRLWSGHKAARRLVAGLLLVGIVLGGVRYAHEYLAESFTANATGDILPSAEGAALSTVLAKTPSDAEVISSIDIVGRLSARKYSFIYLNATSPVPLRAKTVELVMDTAHDPFISATEQEAAAQYLESRFHARTLLHRNGVWELGWSGSPQHSSVVIP